MTNTEIPHLKQPKLLKQGLIIHSKKNRFFLAFQLFLILLQILRSLLKDKSSGPCAQCTGPIDLYSSVEMDLSPSDRSLRPPLYAFLIK